MIKKILMATFLGMILFAVIASGQNNNVVLSLTLKYDDGRITKEGMKLIEGSPPDRLNQPDEGYIAKVISFNGGELYSFKFLIEVMPLSALDPSWFDEEGNQIFFPNETVRPLKELVFVLNFPYFRNAKLIEIYNPNNELVLSVDITEFATCNMNSKCDLEESYEICPEDCSFEEKIIRLSWWQKLINFFKSLFS